MMTCSHKTNKSYGKESRSLKVSLSLAVEPGQHFNSPGKWWRACHLELISQINGFASCSMMFNDWAGGQRKPSGPSISIRGKPLAKLVQLLCLTSLLSNLFQSNLS